MAPHELTERMVAAATKLNRVWGWYEGVYTEYVSDEAIGSFVPNRHYADSKSYGVLETIALAETGKHVYCHDDFARLLGISKKTVDTIYQAQRHSWRGGKYKKYRKAMIKAISPTKVVNNRVVQK